MEQGKKNLLVDQETYNSLTVVIHLLGRDHPGVVLVHTIYSIISRIRKKKIQKDKKKSSSSFLFVLVWWGWRWPFVVVLLVSKHLVEKK